MKVAAFLRGMNLGNRRITNAELRAQFEALGFESVATFQAAGNVVFEGSGESKVKLIERIESGLENGLGYPVPTVLRNAAELRQIADREPFDAAAVAASKGKPQVMLAAKKPSANVRENVLGLAGDDDLLAFGTAELFWLPSGGVSESDLDLRAIDRLLGLQTTRTKGTIERLVAKHLPV